MRGRGSAKALGLIAKKGRLFLDPEIARKLHAFPTGSWSTPLSWRAGYGCCWRFASRSSMGSVACPTSARRPPTRIRSAVARMQLAAWCAPQTNKRTCWTPPFLTALAAASAVSLSAALPPSSTLRRMSDTFLRVQPPRGWMGAFVAELPSPQCVVPPSNATCLELHRLHTPTHPTPADVLAIRLRCTSSHTTCTAKAQPRSQ